MKLVVFGLTVSSSWGNGHATLWRGLCTALSRRGHEVVFFEKDVPYYAAHRDLLHPPGCKLILYSKFEDIRQNAIQELTSAEIGMVTSYCPDATTATELVLNSSVELHIFYDLDTPVTLQALKKGKCVSYIGPRGLQDFDLVLSYTGGAALSELQSQLGARQVATLYGSVDPEVHRPVQKTPSYACDLSYLGTYAEDRQTTLETLFLEPSRRLPQKQFLIGGAQYPPDFPWNQNIRFVWHVPPPEHPAFYCSSLLTLNITRKAMAEMGYCPSGRLFEAAACGVPILSDWWQGLDFFFEPGNEILVAGSPEQAVEALLMERTELRQIALAARDRALSDHTAERRVTELETVLDSARRGTFGLAR